MTSTVAEPARRDRRAARRARRPAAPDVVLGLALAAQGTVAVVLGGRGWFSGDLLHYFVERGGLPDGSEGINDPHRGDWQPALISVYRMLFEIVGLREYAPYVALTVLVHLLVVTLSYRLLVRLEVGRWPALAAALVLLTFGAGSEAFLAEAPVALTGALALGLMAMNRLARTDFDPRSVLVVNVLLLLAVMLSSGGVVASVWVGVFALSRGLLMLVRTTALPAVAYVTWLLVKGHDGGGLSVRGHQWLDVPEAAATLLARPYGDVLLVPAAGGALLVAVVAAVLMTGRSRPQLRAVALAGLVAAAVQSVLRAVADTPVGMDPVLSGPHLYVVLVCLLPAAVVLVRAVAAGLGTALPASTHLALGVVGTVLLLGVVAHGVVVQQSVARSVSGRGDDTKQELRGMIAAVGVGERLLRDSVPGPRYLSGDDLARLAAPDATTELPELTPSHQDRIIAESSFFVSVTTRELDVSAPDGISSASFTDDLSLEPGCREYLASSESPSLVLASFDSAGISVRSGASTVTTRLVRTDLDVAGDTVTWDVDPGDELSIGTTAQVATLEVGFDSGDLFTICVP